ncbi:MAG: hypothetical protein ACI9HU_000251 [Colwellia sp.]|jgi:hypothetical protein
MTYTINGKQYTESDINKRCDELLYGGVRYGAIPVYCHHPLDTWQIIEKCWDELMQDVGFDGDDEPYYDHRFGTRWEYLIDKFKCTKLIAACICLIELNAND